MGLFLKRAATPDAQHKMELAHLGAKPLGSHEDAHHHDTLDHEYGVQEHTGGCMGYFKHEGGWMLASAHILTAIIGAGVLGLPFAMAWLGWIGGIIVLVTFFAITLWSSLLLAEMHEIDGVRHPTYRSAVHAVLGPWNAAAIVVFQYLNLILSSIGYTIIAGSSIRMLTSGYCSRSRHDGGCQEGAWHWSLGFGVLQLFFSQMPNLESAWWSSIVGAAMSVLYSTCALGLAGAQAHNKFGDIQGREAPPKEKAFGVLNALGSIGFAYNFSAVLLEIQDTLHEPPQPRKSMRRAVVSGLSCAFVFYVAISVTGYMALGDMVPGDILTGFSGPAAVVMAANIMVLVHMVSAYQVFSQPVFHGIEEGLQGCLPCTKRWPPLLLRILVRSLYVAVTTTIACLMPFFNDLIGLVGALVFWPAAVYFPVTMYIKVYRPRPLMVGLMQAMNVISAVVSVLAIVGAVVQITRDASTFKIGGR